MYKTVHTSEIVTSGQGHEYIDVDCVAEYDEAYRCRSGVVQPSVIEIGDICDDIRVQYLQALGAKFFVIDGNHRLVAQGLRKPMVGVNVIKNERGYRKCWTISKGIRDSAWNLYGGRGETLEEERERLRDHLDGYGRTICTLEEQLMRLVTHNRDLSESMDLSFLRSRKMNWVQLGEVLDKRDVIETILTRNGRFEDVVGDNEVDENMVLAGIISGLKGTLDCAPAELIGNDDFMRHIIMDFDDWDLIYDAMKLASAKVMDETGTVLVGVKKCPLGLRFASKRVRENDREVIEEAIRGYGGAFEDAGEAFRSDEELFVMAMEGNDCGEAYHHASEEIRGNLKLARKYLPKNIWIVQTVVWQNWSEEEADQFFYDALELAFSWEKSGEFGKGFFASVCDECPEEILKRLVRKSFRGGNQTKVKWAIREFFYD